MTVKTDYEDYLSFDALQNEVRNHTERWNRIKEYIKNRNATGSFLDVGAGCGELIRRLRNEGFVQSWMNVDIKPNYVERLQQEGFAAVVGDARALPFTDKSFDTVICTEVLEHLKDPGKALQELSRVAKKRIIMTLPARRSQDPFHAWLISAEVFGEWVILEWERVED